MSAWQQLEITSPEHYAEQIAELLNELAALSVSLVDAGDQPLFQLEPNQTPLWQHTKILALFNPETDLNPIIKIIEQHIPAELEFTYTVLGEQDWVRKTQENFPPQCYNNSLWVIPSWCESSQFTGTIITIEPGLAFGTGTHPTTNLCLTWLAKNPPRELAVIDFGCGSGILAIAALALGAKKAYAIDHDPQALLATKNNAKLNAFIADKLTITDNNTLPNCQTSLIIANILSAPLITLAPIITNLCAPNAKLILSGLLTGETEQVSAAYLENFTVNKVETLEEWALIELTRK